MPSIASTVTFNTVVSGAFNNSRATIYDNIFANSAFWAFMNLQGRKELDAGGPQIQRSLEFAVNSTTAAFEGFEEFDLTPQDPITALLERWAEVGTAISVSRRDKRINAGEGRIYNFVEALMSNATKSHAQKMNEFVFAVSGSDGKTPVSLPEIMPIATGTTVHGISQTTNTWWDNQRVKSASSANNATSLAVFRQELRHQYHISGLHMDGFSDACITSLLGFEAAEKSMETQVRRGNDAMQRLGFDTLKVGDSTLLWDNLCPGTSANAAAVVASTAKVEENFYFINSEFFKIVVDEASDIVLTDFLPTQKQVAESAKILWMGNLLCTNRRAQSLLYGVDESAIT